MLLRSAFNDKKPLLQSIEKLQHAHPDSIYLELARVFIDPENRTYSHFDKALTALYRRTTATPTEQDDVILLSHLIHQARNHVKGPAIKKWFAKLQSLAHNSKDLVARTHARSLVATHRIDQHVQVSDLLKLLELNPQEEARLPYFVRRGLLRNRAEAHRLKLNFRDAANDFQSLGRIARAANDNIAATMASHGLALVLLDKLSLVSRPADLKLCMDSFLATVDRAKRSSDVATLAQALSRLATLRYGQSGRDAVVDAYLEACFEASHDSRDSKLSARCHIAKSQVLSQDAPKAALTHAKMAQQVLENSPAVFDRIRAWRQVARSLWHLEEHQAALSAAISILGKIEQLRSRQSTVGSKILTLSIWSEDYYWLLSRLIKQDGPSLEHLTLAFQLSERIRARVLLDTLSPSPKSNHPKAGPSLDGASAQTVLVSSEPTAKKLTASDPEKPNLNNLSTTTEPLAFLRDSGFVSPQLVQSKLAPNQAMIVFQTAPEINHEGETIGGTTAFILTKDRFDAMSLPSDRRELERLAGFQRKAFEQGSSSLTAINRRLRDKLAAPILQNLDRSLEHLILVLDGPLHRVSFPQLFPNHELSRTPSASYWARNLHRRHFNDSSIPLVIVDPAPAKVPESTTGGIERSQGVLGQLPRLTYSRHEATHIRNMIHPRSETLSQGQATLSNFVSLTRPNRGLVHIAAHSIVDEQNPSDSYIALAPESEASNPSRLSPRDIAKLNFKDTLVVLGGCATGTGTLLVGEGVLSLAYAFLQSNANAVVATLWPIQDKPSAVFFEFFYECLSNGHSAGYCLDSARRQGRAAGLSKQTTEAFFLLGDGGLRWSVNPSAAKKPASWPRWLAGFASLGLLAGCAHLRRRKHIKRTD